MEYETDSTAVIVVDMQNDFCHPDGALYAPASENVIENVNDVIEFALDDRMPVFYTQDTHTEDSPEFEQWGEHCVMGTWGNEIHDDITEIDYGLYAPKSTYDAFFGNDHLQSLLQEDDIDTLIICGTLVNVCVQETASTANLLGYDVYVVEDAVGYLDEDQKQAALDHIDFLIGETVTTEDL